MKLIFLGSSGSIPTSQRGLPAVALRHERELLLFDCAEGTQRQMVRAKLSPLKIDAIFITHLHGDHFLGLAGLVQTMSLMGRDRKLEVYCPYGEGERIEKYLKIPHYTLTFEVTVQELEPEEEIKRRGYRILTSDAEHSVPSLAYAFFENQRAGKFYPEKAVALGVKPGPNFSRLKSGEIVKLRDGSVVKPEQVLGPPRAARKIVYTGDTRPCDSIVKLARDADVLIHDCTFADELADKAAENAHSTPSEAAEVAKRANVKQLVLLHVSPRYKEDSILLKQAKQIFPNTILASDLMELDVKFQE